MRQTKRETPEKPMTRTSKCRILVRQNQREDDDDDGAPAWHLANPADGSPILSRTSAYLEFANRDEAVAFVESKGMTPVLD